MEAKVRSDRDVDEVIVDLLDAKEQDIFEEKTLGL